MVKKKKKKKNKWNKKVLLGKEMSSKPLKLKK